EVSEAEAGATGATAGTPEAGAARILGVIHGSDRFSHLQNLTPQIDQILKENGLKAGDLTAVAVSHGPGSFTGIRIGVSTARALAQILNIPCIAVPSLEGLALRAQEARGDAPNDAAGLAEGGTEQPNAAGHLLICPALDARRKQVYGAAYEMKDGELVCRIEEASCLMTEFLEKIDRYGAENGGDSKPFERILFLGDGIDTCGEIIEAWASERPYRILYAPKESRYQDAETVALRGLQLYRRGKACDYMDLQPEYLRMAEAEKKLKDRLKQSRPEGGRPKKEQP
ncbi:MAG: tRNA (adenosine(37)-N6)-threonylcarbamoyltransferase complex dimerization subunit type 1 TsaB, partial [Firmicutes bacterium]|nr:tRNA (adenosine(37)-N6)-threonylcarbamoyltransferase complex dimerization subunit type 1 TsaB [Bacillota bacterium]